MKILGSEVLVKLDSEATGGKYYVFEMILEPGAGVPPHVHSVEDEVATVTEGRMEIMVGGTVHQAKAGDWLHLPVGVPHGLHNASDDVARVLFLATPGSGFDAFFGELSQVEMTDPPDMPRISSVLEKYGMRFVDG